jgi:hypothetical protein
MLGKNLLWVAKQHGHSVQTMLDAYAAWIDGSQDADLEAIRTAMEASPRSPARTPSLMLVGSPTCSRPSPEFGTGLALEPRQIGLSRGMRRELYGGKGGTRTLDLGIMSATL